MKVTAEQLILLTQEYNKPEDQILAFVVSKQDCEELLNESLTDSFLDRMLSNIDVSNIDDAIGQEVLNAFINTPR